MKQYISLDEGHIFVTCNGSGPPIVLIHGTASYHFCWRNIYSILSKNHTVYVLDLLGAGESDKPVNASYSKKAHAERLIAVLQKLKISSVHLVGHSMGGEVAVHAALKSPELVKSLTLIAPDGFRKGVNSLVQSLARKGWLNWIFRQMLKRPPNPKMMSRMLGIPSEKLTPELLNGWIKPYSDPNLPLVITKTLADNDTGIISNQVNKLTMSVLLIYGTNDKLIPHHVFESYENNLLDARIEKYEGFGHVLMEECPNKLAKSIFDFIASEEND
ncbi:alpha/beta fold hydrolase [Metabacillus fastidiosus]|uniref:alpha/beta fold hydrolase n=1 Tax=Metabacillus fastidiosus TaxID=1458 RepID=UPI00082578B5|nr:alpha/beta hydrolase [Metabacillus fastidiosus]